jgi:uracil-DNA glycosylase
MVFIGTANQEQILLNNEQQIECAKQTLDLIDILNPKVVLLLGDKTKDLFKKVAKISHMEELIPNYHDFYCFYNNIHVISIYHTAYYGFYTNDRMNVIGKILGYALDNPSESINHKLLESYLSRKMNDF